MELSVFFSWQMETELQGLKMKNFLIKCIQSAINEINDKGDLKNVYLRLYQGLDRIPGNVEVAREMFRQIDECDIFIGDFTVVQKLCKAAEPLLNKKGIFFRYTPNCNVYGEYNRALGKSENFCHQIILLMNNVNGNPHEDTSIIPFDTRGRRFPILFELKDNSKESEEEAKKYLMKVLPNALQASAKAAMNELNNKYYPFYSRVAQKKDKRLNFSLIASSDVDKYRQQIESNKGVMAIVGPKGYSKSILVYKAFDNSDKANNYLYCNSHDTSTDKIKETIEKVLRHKKGFVLVVDRCTDNLLDYMLEQNKRFGSNNSLIAIIDKEEDISSPLEYPLLPIIDLSTSMDELAEQSIKDAGIKSAAQLDAIKNFCQNNTQIIKSLADRVSVMERDFKPTPENLTTIMLGYMPLSDERKIIQALAIFEYVGWTKDKSTELQMILQNKDILPIELKTDVLINKATGIINKGLSEGYFEQKGRTVSICLQPLVEQLITEWLQFVNTDRLIRILYALNQNGMERLAKEFHDRLIQVTNNEAVIKAIKDLFLIGGALENEQVINSKNGSLLLEAFAQVCPEIVVEMLYRFLKSKSFEELRQMESGRRNIVWTLAKLCFIPEIFEKSAECMLILAVSENENFSNNATGQFISLFPLFLPDTEANLEVRLSFLQKMVEIPEYKQIVIRAIKRATFPHDYFRISGNEKCGQHERQSYQPSSNDELCKYIDGCITILKNEIERETAVMEQSIEVLENNCAALCDAGYANIVLPVIQFVAKKKNGDWDNMYKSLAMFQSKLSPKLKEYSNLYNSLLDYLRKDDIVSRFTRIEHESFYGYEKDLFEKCQQTKSESYKMLAESVYKNGDLNDDNLKGLMCADVINSTPFGETLAKLMTPEEQIKFISDFVRIANKSEKVNPSILIDFVAKVNEEVFCATKEELKCCCISYVFFACLARRSVLPSMPLFDELCKLILDRKANVTDFQQYWINLRNDLMSQDMVYDFFSKVLQFEDSFDVVVHMSLFIRINGGLEHYPKIANLLEEAYMKNTTDEEPITSNSQTLELINKLLDNGNCRELAIRVNRQTISYASSADVYFFSRYELESMYVLLMTKYFAEIWPDLSNALLSENENYMTYYNLKNLLGINIVNGKTPVIMAGDHFDEMLSWCEANKEIAPAHLAGMIMAAIDGQFTPEARKLIDLYADQPYVLNEIECSLGSFSSIGSVVPYYEEQEKIFETLLMHKNATVRRWAQQQINNCKYLAQHESERESEKW